jgi:hypothetical protein
MSIGLYVGKLIFQASGVDGRDVTVKVLKPRADSASGLNVNHARRIEYSGGKHFSRR